MSDGAAHGSFSFEFQYQVVNVQGRNRLTTEARSIEDCRLKIGEWAPRGWGGLTNFAAAGEGARGSSDLRAVNGGPGEGAGTYKFQFYSLSKQIT
ncbi:MAG: hypothetical protein WCC59_02300 [Terriglobales bacterium]